MAIIRSMGDCFQRFKDTKKKANHNTWSLEVAWRVTVSNDSKILKRKLITTKKHLVSSTAELFPTIQRY